MRLIDADAAIVHLKNRLYETELNNNTEHYYYKEMADNRVSVWIEELPTIDTEELCVLAFNTGYNYAKAERSEE